MEVLYPRCCGLDIHKASVTACLLTPGPAGRPRKEVRRFETMTDDLLRLGEWLGAAGCTHVAMESTGAYWKPIWNLLEDRFALLLVNAAHVKAVPGRKTDVRDSEWLAELLRHGLLRPSFVPDRPQRELRELTRYRTQLVRERAAAVNRLQKTLEGANIKLASVVTDLTGVSGRAMLAALVAGEADAAAVADLARGRLRGKGPRLERALERALVGRWGAHQRFLVAEQPAHLDALEARVARLSDEIAERLRPFDAAAALLQTIPGVGRLTAEVVLAEVGADMGRFPTAGHLASGAGMCPGNHESAGCPLGDAAQRPDARRRPVAADGPGPSGARGGPDPGHLPRRPVPTADGAAGPEAGRGGGRALHPAHHLPPARRRHRLPGSRPDPLRRAGAPVRRAPVGAPARRARLHRLPHTGRLTTDSIFCPEGLSSLVSRAPTRLMDQRARLTPSFGAPWSGLRPITCWRSASLFSRLQGWFRRWFSQRDSFRLGQLKTVKFA